ncbi:MAG: excinuclease ABC subunit UvrC [Polyangiaceae bacterium]|nr:excinuclease ABC subunit UvrC [Polyangiaceae bacterium]
MPPETVKDKLDALPPQPGCYLFRDGDGKVLYVGKAKSLRARVRSYFQQGSSDGRAFIPFLRRLLADLETIVTGSEKEAAILENSLIKEHRPRYNVKLRDDKEYLSLRLNLAHRWPRLELVRRPAGDGARYFGPYHSATAARRTLQLVEKHFQLRTCTDRELVSRRRPCLQHQIGRCPAPCVFAVDGDEYAAQVRAVALFLDGRHDEVVGELEARMRQASERLDYELAARYRDQLEAVKLVREEQRVVSVTDRDQDVVGLYREGDLVELVVLCVRAGKVVEVLSFSSQGVEVPDDEVIAAFLREHYKDGGSASAMVPDEVLVPVLPEGAGGVSEWLSDRRRDILQSASRQGSSRCRLMAPRRGPRRGLLELAQQNARHAFDEKRRQDEDMRGRLERVRQRLRLPRLPERIECCDISHLGGHDTVGAIVSLQDGVPDKKRYRSYHVTTTEGGDDYAALREVLSRRFLRGRSARADPGRASEPSTVAAPAARAQAALPEQGPGPAAAAEPGALWQLPDLFIVDGGRGQLAVALTVARDLGILELPIVGLAKEKESPTGDKLVDRVYLPGQKNAIQLRANGPELFILARARDEAHRFANRGRKAVGKRRRLASELDAIHGIGPKTRRALLTALGSVERVFSATDDELLGVPGVTRRHVQAVRQYVSGRAPESGESGPS